MEAKPPLHTNFPAIRTLSRQPFRVTIDFSLELSAPYDVQQLRRAVEPMKSKNEWMPRSADAISAIYLRNTSNVHRLLLAESDSLFLMADQIKSFLAAVTTASERAWPSEMTTLP